MLNITHTLIAGGFYRGDNSWNKEASHLDKCFKLYSIKEGRAGLVSADAEYFLEAGKVYFINGIKMKEQYCRDSFCVYWLHFLPESFMLKQALQQLPLVTQIYLDKFRDNYGEFKVLEKFFSSYSTQKNFNDGNVFNTYLKIQAILLNILRVLSENTEMNSIYGSANSGRLSRAVQFINANYKEQLHLKQLAELCYMSENYFHSLFKKEFTVTPNNYVLQLRMNEALNLLSSTNMSIKEVGLECGYHDAAYFSRTFTKYFSLSPNKYRGLHSVRVP